MTENQTPELTDQVSGQTLTYNDKEYLVSELSPDTQKLIGFYTLWEADLLAAKAEVFKLEAALRGLIAEMDFVLKNELK